jgi:hypothetical protein
MFVVVPVTEDDSIFAVIRIMLLLRMEDKRRTETIDVLALFSM